MKMKDIKVGMLVREVLSNEVVKVVSTKASAHYGPNRPIRVRFADHTLQYYAPEDLMLVKESEKSQPRRM